MIPNW